MGDVGVPPALNDAVVSLKESITAGRTDIFRKLLEACETCEGGGPEERKQLVNSHATNDGTFLHMATKLGHSDIVRALLAAGADPGIIDKDGNTPLQVAPTNSILAIFMEDLLRATAKSEIGRVCQLLASGMSVNAYDNPLSKNTPLHWAASFADLDTLNCLIARGADVNICNSDGATPLHDAVAREDSALVGALLEQGANPHIQCQHGKYKGLTAYQMAHKNPKVQILMEKFFEQPHRNGISNGSVSPILARRLLQDSSGSVDALSNLNIEKESTVTEVNSNSHVFKSNLTLKRAQSIASFSGESIISNSHTVVNGNVRSPRSPLESTSSLELTPNMEQVCERLAAVHLNRPPRPLVTNSVLHYLWPQPKRIIEIDGPSWKVPKLVNLSIISSGTVVVHQIVDIWNIHKPWLGEIGCEVQLGSVIGPRNINGDNNVDIICAVDPALTLSEAHYKVSINENGVYLVSGSLLSLHHALVTFTQLLRVFKMDEASEKHQTVGLCIPPLVILDFPSIPNRGFLLDLAPSARIPKLERVCQIVDSLMSLKINQLHMMFKINFKTNAAFEVDKQIYRPSYVECNCYLPYTSSELLSLERYCCDRGITLVPGFELEIESSASSPFTVKDISFVISETLIHLPSTRFVHFGPFLTSFLSKASNTSPLCDPWAQLQFPVTAAALMVCANVFHSNRTALQKLPLTTILVEYGFQADYDFTQGCKLATETGRTISVCSGTAAWTSLSGWPEAGVSNSYSGVVSSLESGASCLLVAHWSNTACLTPFVFTWPPLLVAAGLSWNHTTHWDFVHSSVGTLIDKHLVKVPNCGLGDAIIEMGRCETWLTRVARDQSANDPSNLPSCDGSTLHQLLVNPDSVVVDHLTPEAFSSVMRLVRKSIKEGANRFQTQSNIGITQIAAASSWPLATLCVLELHVTVDMILTACRLGRALVTVGTNPRSNMGMAVVNPGVANLPPTLRTDLANKILALREVYSSVWLQGQQPNALQCSLLVFSSLLSKLLPEQTVHGV